MPNPFCITKVLESLRNILPSILTPQALKLLTTLILHKLQEHLKDSQHIILALNKIDPNVGRIVIILLTIVSYM